MAGEQLNVGHDLCRFLRPSRSAHSPTLPDAGASLKEMQEWAGHSSYTTTANICAHLQTNGKNKDINAPP